MNRECDALNGQRVSGWAKCRLFYNMAIALSYRIMCKNLLFTDGFGRLYSVNVHQDDVLLQRFPVGLNRKKNRL